jgi:hypothetical protein
MSNPLSLWINVLFVKNVSWQTFKIWDIFVLYNIAKFLWIFSYNYATACVNTLSITKYNVSTLSAIPYTTYRQEAGKPRFYQQS